MKEQIKKIKTTPILLGGLGGAAVGTGIAYFTGVKNTKTYLIYAGIGLVVGGAACYFFCKKKDVVSVGGDTAKTAKASTETPKTDAGATQENSAEFAGKRRIRSPYLTKEGCERMTYKGNDQCASFKSAGKNN